MVESKKKETLKVCKECPVDKMECSISNKVESDTCCGCVCVGCTPEHPFCSQGQLILDEDED